MDYMTWPDPLSSSPSPPVGSRARPPTAFDHRWQPHVLIGSGPTALTDNPPLSNAVTLGGIFPKNDEKCGALENGDLPPPLQGADPDTRGTELNDRLATYSSHLHRPEEGTRPQAAHAFVAFDHGAALFAQDSFNGSSA